MLASIRVDIKCSKPLCVRLCSEYRLAVLNSQLSGSSDKVKVLISPADFFRLLEESMSRPKFEGPAITESETAAKAVVDKSSDIWKVALTNTCIALLGYMIIVHILLLRKNRADKKKNVHDDSKVELLGEGPIAANWEWQPEPERGVDERSSDLDDFFIQTNSETSMVVSMSGT